MLKIKVMAVITQAFVAFTGFISKLFASKGYIALFVALFAVPAALIAIVRLIKKIFKP